MRLDRVRHAFCSSVILVVAFVVAAPAMAQTPYDGLWNVTILTKTGSCEATAHYPLTVSDGKIVAARMAFLLGEELYLYYSGYDLAWRKHSIMTTLMCECFKWAIERGVKVVNLSTGKDPSKLRWRGREVMFHNALLMSPTRRGRLISRAYDLLSRQPNLFVRLTEL